MADDTLLRPSEAAHHLGVSVETIRRWIRSGRLKAFYRGPGKRQHVRQADLDQRVERSTGNYAAGSTAT